MTDETRTAEWPPAVRWDDIPSEVARPGVTRRGFGTDNVYSPDRLASWVANMNPDVVTFNEIEKYTGWGNENQPEVYKALLQQKTGRTWYSHFAQEFGQWSSNGKGNLILSTYPIGITDNYELVHNADRSIGMASTRLPPPSSLIQTNSSRTVSSWFRRNRAPANSVIGRNTAMANRPR